MVVYNGVMHQLSPGILDTTLRDDHHFDHIDHTKRSGFNGSTNRQKILYEMFKLYLIGNERISMEMCKVLSRYVVGMINSFVYNLFSKRLKRTPCQTKVNALIGFGKNHTAILSQ